MQKCRLPIEIVVGDDASTDGTRAVCEDYARRYPDIVRLMPAAPNKGMVDNYFDCMLACRGKYIADCAGDDYWTDPKKLDKEVEIMEADPSVTIVHTNWRTYNEDTHETKDNAVEQFPAPKTEASRCLRLLSHKQPPPWCISAQPFIEPKPLSAVMPPTPICFATRTSGARTYRPSLCLPSMARWLICPT